MKSLSTMSKLNSETAQLAVKNSCAANSQAYIRRDGRLSSPMLPALAVIGSDDRFSFAAFCAQIVADVQVLKHVVMGTTQNPVEISTNEGKYHAENEWNQVGRVGQYKGRLQ